MEVSLANSLALVTGSEFTPSTEDATYAAVNAQTPQRPFLPWRTTALGAQNLVIDFGAARTISLVILVNTNFTSATIQGNATNVWGSPSFSQNITIARNPQMWRYQHGVMISGFNYRFLRILIPSQTPVDGVAYYSLGGLWAGTLATLPRPFRWESTFETFQPRQDVMAPGGSRKRLSLGEPIARATVRAYSKANENRPMLNDQLADWLNIERQLRASDFFALVPEVSGVYDTAQILIWRRVNQTQWPTSQLGLVESTWELEEMT